jgi:hypothetical protein
VWPTPAEFVDPFSTSVRRDQEDDLWRIVDDIMGPGERSGHTPSSSFSSRTEADQIVGPSGARDIGGYTSYTGSVDEFRARPQSQRSVCSYSYEPQGESEGESTTANNSVPPGAAPAIHDSGHDPIVICPGAYSAPLSTRAAAGGPSVVNGLAAWRPKKPSPLARPISTASHKMGDTTRMWLDRKVKRGPNEGGSGGADLDVDDATR